MLYMPKKLDEKLLLHFSICSANLALRHHHEFLCDHFTGYHDPDFNTWTDKMPEVILFPFYQNFKNNHLRHYWRSPDQEHPCCDDIRYLGDALDLFYRQQRNYHDKKTVLDFCAKAMAATLSYLAIIHYDCWFRTANYRKRIQAGKKPCKPLWADAYSVAVGKKGDYVDFLPCCKAAIQQERSPNPETATIYVWEIAAKFKRITGVDLTQYGFQDFVIKL